MTTVAPNTRKRTSFVYAFDQPAPGGRDLLGGKGLGLSEMAHLDIPVPAGFTITTDACRAFLTTGGDLPDGLEDEIADHIERLERATGATFGSASNPLLLSVRSGAAISMPGMMDSILDLGLNDEAVRGLAAATGNDRFAQDSYRRLIQMYGEVVDGIDSHRFEDALGALRSERGVENDVDLTASDLQLLIERYKQIYEQEAGHAFPADAYEQLLRAVRAVFDSWNSPRARVYRQTYEIPEHLGTAVNVMQMVFGNRGNDCGTGVCFSRDPSTGDRGICGEFLLNAQGEDVVAGIRRPVPLEEMRKSFPAAFDQLERHGRAARAPLPRRSGHRVHGRTGPAVSPADQVGKADSSSRGEGRGRDGRGRVAEPRRRDRKDRARAAGPPPPPHARSDCELRRRRERSRRFTGCCFRPCGVRRGHRRDLGARR